MYRTLSVSSDHQRLARKDQLSKPCSRYQKQRTSKPHQRPAMEHKIPSSELQPATKRARPIRKAESSTAISVSLSRRRILSSSVAGVLLTKVNCARSRLDALELIPSFLISGNGKALTAAACLSLAFLSYRQPCVTLPLSLSVVFMTALGLEGGMWISMDLRLSLCATLIFLFCLLTFASTGPEAFHTHWPGRS